MPQLPTLSHKNIFLFLLSRVESRIENDLPSRTSKQNYSKAYLNSHVFRNSFVNMFDIQFDIKILFAYETHVIFDINWRMLKAKRKRYRLYILFSWINCTIIKSHRMLHNHIPFRSLNVLLIKKNGAGNNENQLQSITVAITAYLVFPFQFS